MTGHSPDDALAGTESPTSVLLSTAALDCDEAVACGALSTVVPHDEVDVLYATVTQSPGARLDTWRSQADGPPAKAAVVSVDEMNHSSTTPGGNPDGPRSEHGRRTVTDPSRRPSAS